METPTGLRKRRNYSFLPAQRLGPVLACLCLGMLLFSTSGFAATTKPEPKHSFELAGDFAYFKYEEDLMEEKGMFYGLDGAYIYRGPLTDDLDRAMIRGELRTLFGQVDYDGQLQDGTPYEINNINDYMIELRGVGGYDFDVFTNTRLTPYFGFGYRYLNDDAATDPAGYERESNYYYSPIGVETLTPLSNGWAWGVKVEYDIFWYGQQRSHLSDAVASLSDIENDQEGGYGVRGAIKFQKKAEDLDFFIEPYVCYWDIDESETADVTISGTIIGTAVEPKNHSIEYGVRVGMKF